MQRKVGTGTGGGGGGGAGSYDVANAAYDSVSLTTIATNTTSIQFRDDGSSLYETNTTDDRVYQQPVLTPFDLSTAAGSPTHKVLAEAAEPQSGRLNSTGDALFVFDRTTSSVYSYTLASAWAITSAVYDTELYDFSSQTTGALGGHMSPDGLTMYVLGDNNSIFQYTLGTSFDLAGTVTPAGSLNVSTQLVNPTGMAFNGDGTKMYVVGLGSGGIQRYALSTAYDITSATHEALAITLTEDSTLRDLIFNATGSKMYALGGTNIFQYSV